MKIFIAILLFSTSALADLDQRCFNDCKQSDSYQLCTEKCSYGNNNQQHGSDFYRYQPQQQNPYSYGGDSGKYRYRR